MAVRTSSETALAGIEAALADERWAEARDSAADLLAGDADDGIKARALLLSARALWHLGQIEQVLQHALDSVLLARARDDQALQISASTLATFSLAELGCADAGLPLALRALQATERANDGLYMLRPVALSCAAYVHACLAQAQQSEALHMEALSLAREGGSPEGLHMAFCNLALSLSLTHREALRRQDASLAQVATAYAQKHIPQLRRLARDERLDRWRRVSLLHDLAELLAFCGSVREAEALYRESLQEAEGQLTGYYALNAKADLAELLSAQGRHQEAFDLLAPAVAEAQDMQGGYRRWLLVLRALLSCCQALGLASEARELQARMAATELEFAAVRQRVLARLAAAKP
ncbi:hypothetical protein J7U46_04810 [Pelomonas sp. V22]|uniref:hypothetical protein n=1 Tax=Pelomonas sp. V22 TaxID=2822139 RepID=UPI0024A8A975|nr:hypothetical protein [Pelomonas sp. V22]MDI4632361.1 hypothetical protein [Pelomonas sp. V22]